MKIISDNKPIYKCLTDLETIIGDNGGFIDPELVIRNQGSNLSVEKHGFAKPGSPLIALPAETLFPTGSAGLFVKNEEIGLAPEKGALSELQMRIAQTMVELYNLTGKIPAHKDSCCWFVFKENPDILEKLLAARTLNPYQQSNLDFCKSSQSTEEVNKALCDTYIKMRTIGHKQAPGEDGQISMTTDIMPIVDFINHHSGGSFFGFKPGFDTARPEREFLLVNDHRPLPFSNECFAFYNHLDALDSFIQYGFADAFSVYVRSIPIELEIPNTGKIIARSVVGPLHKGTLPANAAGLRPYIPATLATDPEKLEISSFLIPTNPGTPHALRRVLRLLITNRAALKRTLSAKQIWDAVLAAEEKIIGANLEFYQKLLASLDKEKAQEGSAKAQHVQMVRDVANLQLGKLYKYSFDESHFAESAESEEEIAAAG